VERVCFSGPPKDLDTGDGPSSNFPYLKIAQSLKRLALEGKYLLLVVYNFVIPNLDATVNKLP